MEQAEGVGRGAICTGICTGTWAGVCWAPIWAPGAPPVAAIRDCWAAGVRGTPP